MGNNCAPLLEESILLRSMKEVLKTNTLHWTFSQSYDLGRYTIKNRRKDATERFDDTAIVDRVIMVRWWVSIVVLKTGLRDLNFPTNDTSCTVLSKVHTFSKYEGHPKIVESCWISREPWQVAYGNFTCLWHRPIHTFDTKLNAIGWRHKVWLHSDWRHMLDSVRGDTP